MWAKRMVDTMLERTPLLSNTTILRDKWSYDYGVVLKGVELVWHQTKNQKYFDYILDNMDPFVSNDGTIRGYDFNAYNIDHLNNGKVLLTLYKATKEDRFKKAIDLLREQLNHHPKTSDGVFWHKQVYPHQIWLDGLYMGAPFYAEYAKAHGCDKDFSKIAKQYLLCYQHLKDSETGLLYHAYDEKRLQPWCNPKTGLSRNFWGRSMGWFVMGLIDTLSFFPVNHADREQLITVLTKTLEALRKVQDERGVWYQVLNAGGRKGNYLEASASCMILYAMAKGMRLGVIDESWLMTAIKAYHGIVDEFVLITDNGWVNLNKTCQVAGLGGQDKRDGSYAYYISEPIICNDQKGVGAFILAMAEMETLLGKK